jgi:hypothetical protein
MKHYQTNVVKEQLTTAHIYFRKNNLHLFARSRYIRHLTRSETIAPDFCIRGFGSDTKGFESVSTSFNY